MALVARPVQDRAGVAGGMALTKTRWCGKRFVRVKALQMQHPVVSIAVGVQKIKTGNKSVIARSEASPRSTSTWFTGECESLRCTRNGGFVLMQTFLMSLIYRYAIFYQSLLDAEFVAE